MVPAMKRVFFAAVLLALPALAAPLMSMSPAAAPKLPPLPQPLPRGDHVSPSTMPAFLGMFGPAALVQKTGFRSSPGRWLEYALTNTASPGMPAATMRLQEVGPPLAGARWIEVLTDAGGGVSAGIKMLVRGLKDGNVERLIASMPSFPTMELPLASATFSKKGASGPGQPLGLSQASVGVPQKVGRETVVVPLGKFECTHWVVTGAGQKIEIWTTTDRRVPFIGAVKMTGNGGIALLSKVGTHALAKIPVPPRAH